MSAICFFFALAVAALGSAQPRLIGDVVRDDVAAITAAIRTVTRDRIVEIRAASIAGRVVVQTESSPSAGCRYLVQRTDGIWKILGKSCWTHTTTWPQDAEQRWPRLTRPSELSEADFDAIKAAVARETHDKIRTVRIIQMRPLTVQVHTASTHVVTEGDYTLEKIDTQWKLTKKDWWIH